MTSFRIEIAGAAPGSPRLIASSKLNRSDFDTVADALGTPPVRARKIGFVSARKAKERTVVETRWNGKESMVTAEPGDWIVTNMTPDRQLMRDGDGHLNVYAIGAGKFPSLYAREPGMTDEGAIYRAISEVEALFFPGGFEIVAPWGEMQRAGSGYILRNGDDIYGNAKATFEATYAVGK